MTKTIENTTFVLKDQDGNYVSSYSINYNASTKRVSYSYSKFLTNGFYTQSTRKRAEAHLDKLNQMQTRFQLPGKSFRIEEINRREVLFAEHQIGVPKNPFQYEYFDFDDGKDYLWVIKNCQNNFVDAKSVRKWDAKNWIYSSYKTFSPECRGYGDLFKAEMSLDVLKYEAEKMRLDESFHLEYVNMDDLIKDYKTFQGNNMVFVERSVVA